MTTLLLTFFVMLLSLASMQEPELIGRGRDSFTFSLRNLGLGLLLGRKSKADFDNIKISLTIEMSLMLPSAKINFFLKLINAKAE
mgnify:CR=1 FL=1